MKEITEESKIKAANTYNAAADHFDDPALSFWNRFGTRSIERLGLADGDLVLDLACGSGASALPAARAVAPTGKVTGVDLSENLLQLARNKARAQGLSNIEFINGDMTRLPYPGNQFDAVVCVFGIFFVPDMESLIREFWRMVKPRGQLAITTWGPDIFAPVYETWRQSVKQERPDLYSAFNPWDRITDIPSVQNLFRAAGITTVDVVAESGAQPLREPEDWWTIALGSGLRWTIDQMGPAVAERVRRQNLDWITANQVKSVATNVIYAVARKDEV